MARASTGLQPKGLQPKGLRMAKGSSNHFDEPCVWAWHRSSLLQTCVAGALALKVN